jgi:Domain of unknown function (DUF1707)/Cell wall-active antibiotics response 4TMS YvqF
MTLEPARLEPARLEAERQRGVDALRKMFADDVLTMDEYAERVGTMLEVRTEGELVAATKDLGLEAATPVLVGQRRKTSSTAIAIFGGNERTGRWRVPPNVRMFAVFGGAKLDFREASTSAEEIVVTSVSAFGSVDVIVPEGIDVELSGFALFGGKKIDVASVPVLPGMPIIRVRAIALFGGVEVKSKKRKMLAKLRDSDRKGLKQ